MWCTASPLLNEKYQYNIYFFSRYFSIVLQLREMQDSRDPLPDLAIMTLHFRTYTNVQQVKYLNRRVFQRSLTIY